ncbi:MAG TPA: DUF892 family protein [Candidatus Saccharimonadia bacterium]|jgi:ferritin-like metal-binding protein YciE
MTGKEQLISRLNDAYAMEKAQHKILEGQLDDAKDFEDLRSRLEEHIQETNTQCDRLEQGIESLGGKLSGMKGASGSFMGTIQGMTTGLGADKLVKHTMADFAAEHYEIAMYETIKTAATELGYREIVQMCDDTIREEQDMADFLHEQLPATVTAAVQSAAGVETTEAESTAGARPEPAFGERIDDNGEDVI